MKSSDNITILITVSIILALNAICFRLPFNSFHLKSLVSVGVIRALR